ncbi:uncharacterized protein LOC131025964 isoform X2 [Salvia miltiorrhiza]|uniref:uncharacterized protein LOC131025964 isoform X2 n=1 Tax=Salvia miltiorrhiza TaxID=226208 RepID=UPI0025AD3766|nr:uncharacterized protein LOC131025964 isoform X2 [Salvia miltiorrhiza]
MQVRLRLLLCPFGSNIVVRTAWPLRRRIKMTNTNGLYAGLGRFEIISLSGSFLLSESIGNCSRTGGLSISLAGSDGRVLGGGVFGMLKAASPVQVHISPSLYLTVTPNFVMEKYKMANALSDLGTKIWLLSGDDINMSIRNRDMLILSSMNNTNDLGALNWNQILKR